MGGQIKHVFQDDFIGVANEIIAECMSSNDWAAIESCDMFQRGPYCGGFDATEMAFTFSFYAEDGSELWFELSLDEVGDVVAGRRTFVEARVAG